MEFYFLYLFQPFKNVEAFLSSKAVQKQVVSLIWHKHSRFPTPELKYYACTDSSLIPLTVYFFSNNLLS